MARQSGEKSQVSQVANEVPRTRLNRPTSLNSPTARTRNTKPRMSTGHLKSAAGTSEPKTPALPRIRVDATKSATATANVAAGVGVNARCPLTSGTTEPEPSRPPSAQNTWGAPRAANTSAREDATTSGQMWTLCAPNDTEFSGERKRVRCN